MVNSFKHIKVSYDVGAQFQGSQGVDLVDGALLQFGHFLEFVGFDHFDSDFLFSYQMNSFKNP